MAIKDKDGKVYKLRGPNPLLKSQQEWDNTKIKLFNMNSRQEEVVEDIRNPIEKFNANVVDIGEDLKLKKKNRAKVVEPSKFMDEIREMPKEETPTVFKMPEPVVTQTVLNVDPKMARILKERGAEYYCAPAIGRKNFTDDFYGSTYDVIEYGDKFIFDAVVIDQSDLELQFWCVKPVTAQSIIYKKVKQGGERWWRIKDVESKTGGWLAKAIISDSNPDFS
jgi:hypothetical protein